MPNMGKRDPLREYLLTAIEAYNLAATPQPTSLYKDTLDEYESIEQPMPTDSRKALLDLSIDVKTIFHQFITNLAPQRAGRFITWVQEGYIEQFHTEHREQIIQDQKRLQYSIIVYRISGAPY